MIPINNISGKKVAVMGLGRSGLRTAQALQRAGGVVHAWDDSAAGRKAAEVADVTLVPLAEQSWADTVCLLYTSPSPRDRG